ncbi:hypothetical protein [Mesoterricola silvestris]|uniref:Uncharacterized protein n=1 Tax=Mesoterricola silvestris TaxID=2927979 RepID=A0AA48KA30_9BACT|nr:hypothetical protein [Mesoterricola silvestris]BDU72907.1 hypothetical protein METEAL_20810 [Mesoterricola silvestris]
MPFDAALNLAESRLKEENKAAIRHLQQCYFSSLGLYSNSTKVPPPPKVDAEDT